MRLAIARLALIEDQIVKKRKAINPQAKQKHIGTKYGLIASLSGYRSLNTT